MNTPAAASTPPPTAATNSLAHLTSLVKVGALTFAGTFLGAFAMAGPLPTTAAGWKALAMPALGAAIAAEIIFLRAQIAALLAQGSGFAVGMTTATMTKTTVVGAVLLVGMLFGGGPVGCGGTVPPPSPQTVVQDVVTGEQAICIILNSALPLADVQKACNITSALLPIVQQIIDNELASRKRAVDAAMKGHAFKAPPPWDVPLALLPAQKYRVRTSDLGLAFIPVS